MNKFFFLAILCLYIPAQAASSTLADSEDTSLLSHGRISPMRTVQSKEWAIVEANVKLLQKHGIELIDRIPGFDRFLATHEQNFRNLDELQRLNLDSCESKKYLLSAICLMDIKAEKTYLYEDDLRENSKKELIKIRNSSDIKGKIRRVSMIFDFLLLIESFHGNGSLHLSYIFENSSQYEMQFEEFPLQSSVILSDYFKQRNEQTDLLHSLKWKSISIAAGKATEENRRNWLRSETYLAETLRLEIERRSRWERLTAGAATAGIGLDEISTLSTDEPSRRASHGSVGSGESTHSDHSHESEGTAASGGTSMSTGSGSSSGPTGSSSGTTESDETAAPSGDAQDISPTGIRHRTTHR